MSLSPVSFGKKIPISKCYVKDIQKNELTEAVISELDCEDESDIFEIEKLDNGWEYKEAMLNRMKRKFSKSGINLYDNYFYIMENKDGDIIAISQTRDENPDLTLNYLEAKGREKYKYVGQNMLCFLSQIAQKYGRKRIYIPIPTLSAWNFYTKKCGFRRASAEDCALVLSVFGMKLLQHRVKRRLNSKKICNKKLPEMDSNHC